MRIVLDRFEVARLRVLLECSIPYDLGGNIHDVYSAAQRHPGLRELVSALGDSGLEVTVEQVQNKAD